VRQLHAADPSLPAAGAPPARPTLSGLWPAVDGGRRALKAIAGDPQRFEVDALLDGHDLLTGELRHRHEEERRWQRVPLVALGNDRYGATLSFSRLGRHEVVAEVAVDHFGSWRREVAIKAAAGEDIGLELLTGGALARAAAVRARGNDRRRLMEVTEPFAARPPLFDELVGDEVAALCARYPDPAQRVTSAPYPVQVERERALVGAWYELFPRSCAEEEGAHGTFRDVLGRLDYLAHLGIDVLYLPPVHPIGTTHRKGRNGATEAGPEDPGSPWAIGGPSGGHTALHPELGSFADFDALVAAAAQRGVEVALDLAFQCSPDHPWVREHPQWFRHRADGSIRYAENPPKRYEDIYPIDFESRDWRNLWQALRGVVEFWVERGIRIFRVDNPHTKPFSFWEWLIREVQRRDPEVVFLAEAFTRPKVMGELAKLGFSQSYTYFAWRQGKEELVDYLRELTSPEMAAYFRPNLWPNTPDILTEQLQRDGAAAFALRALLAATLSASWGIYGPAFEQAEHRPRSVGSEEYLDSEKYELRHWHLDEKAGVAPLVAQLNALRRAEAALRRNTTLAFYGADNPALLAYSKHPGAGEAGATVLCVANLDAHYPQSGWVELPAGFAGPEVERFDVHDLLSGERYHWQVGRNFVILDPKRAPGHLFAVEPSTPAPTAAAPGAAAAPLGAGG